MRTCLMTLLCRAPLTRAMLDALRRTHRAATAGASIKGFTIEPVARRQLSAADTRFIRLLQRSYRTWERVHQ